MIIDQILELIEQLEAGNANRSGRTRWAIAQLRAHAETAKVRLEGAGDEPYIAPSVTAAPDTNRAARQAANREAHRRAQAELREKREAERAAAGWINGKRWEPYEIEAATKMGFDDPAIWRRYMTERMRISPMPTPEEWRALARGADREDVTK